MDGAVRRRRDVHQRHQSRRQRRDRHALDARVGGGVVARHAPRLGADRHDIARARVPAGDGMRRRAAVLHPPTRHVHGQPRSDLLREHVARRVGAPRPAAGPPHGEAGRRRARRGHGRRRRGGRNPGQRAAAARLGPGDAEGSARCAGVNDQHAIRGAGVNRRPLARRESGLSGRPRIAGRGRPETRVHGELGDHGRRRAILDDHGDEARRRDGPQTVRGAVGGGEIGGSGAHGPATVGGDREVAEPPRRTHAGYPQAVSRIGRRPVPGTTNAPPAGPERLVDPHRRRRGWLNRRIGAEQRHRLRRRRYGPADQTDQPGREQPTHHRTLQAKKGETPRRSDGHRRARPRRVHPRSLGDPGGGGGGYFRSIAMLPLFTLPPSGLGHPAPRR